ncbi:hypothetical protein Syun_004664 [Stephania yunnanensis]|uniref:Uncharacterized protein n=1 Tax=Stephania yunnanensis TaxID=152371 RepID=A0AAP0Q122_9MAGN
MVSVDNVVLGLSINPIKSYYPRFSVLETLMGDQDLLDLLQSPTINIKFEARSSRLALFYMCYYNVIREH